MRYNNLVLTGSLQQEDILSKDEKVFIVDDVFKILEDSYRDVKGGLHFTDKDELINKTNLWKIIYLDEIIVGVIIYKAKNGLKMVALGIANFISRKSQSYIKTMLSAIFKLTFSNTWMEVSEGVEKFIIKNGGDVFFIKNTMAAQLTGKEILSLDTDGYHYTRKINGVIKTKIMIGTFKI